MPGKPEITGGEARVTCESATALKKAELHYTTDGGLRSERNWTSVPARIEGKVIIAPAPPPEANSWFLSVTDERGAMVSTVVVLR